MDLEGKESGREEQTVMLGRQRGPAEPQSWMEACMERREAEELLRVPL